jgi:DNA-binding NarL/FixJ family response regulator
MTTKVAIACSNQIFAEGLKKILEDVQDIEVVGIYNGSNGFLSDLKATLRLRPDIILAECSPEFNKIADLADGLDELKRIKIILIGDRQTQFMSDKFLRELISKGVLGILPPSADSDLLKKALQAIQDGEVWLDRESLIKLLSAMQRPEKYVKLGKREKEIIVHICQGYRNKEIANKLNISEQTVKSHCNRIYKKLGVSDRLQLALFSQKNLSYSADA